MPIRQVPNSDRRYYLVAFDKNANERTNDPDGIRGRMTERVLTDLAASAYTDVFIVSHGWKGDVRGAIDQYDRWIGVMVQQGADIARMRAKNPAYMPFIIGLHWPSDPWGEEELPGSGGSFSSTPAAIGSEYDVSRPPPTIDELVEAYVERLADDAEAADAMRPELRRIFEAARQSVAPPQLPPDVVTSYNRINALAELADGELNAGPAEDRAPFDPQRAYRATRPLATSFGVGDGIIGTILSPLKQLSFWKMKKRAQTFGQNGASPFLDRIQAAAPNARVHAAGHSFGCIVVSAMLNGEDNNAAGQKIHSAILLQGALSLWSYCSSIEYASGAPGYFHPFIARKRIAGAFVTSQSRFDKAVGFWYPKAAGLAGQVTYALGLGELPKYGSVGTFGIQGPETSAIAMDMLPSGASYNFERGGIYNVNGERYIKDTKDIFSGAHSDIVHPEVAHAVWEAVLVD